MVVTIERAFRESYIDSTKMVQCGFNVFIDGEWANWAQTKDEARKIAERIANR